MYKKHLPREICFTFCLVFFLACSTTPDTNDRSIVIPFTLENGVIVLEAVIDGRAGRFAWDNAANFSIIPGARSRPERWYRYTVVGGEQTLVPFYQIDSIRFGNIDVRAQSWFINIVNDFAGRGTVALGFDGMLGNGIFNGFWVELSFSRNEIVLHREKPAHFANTSHAPLKSMLEITGERTDRFYLPVDIDGEKFLMLFDTGAWFHAFAFPNGIANNTSPDNVRRITSNREPWDYYLVQTNSITILDRTYHDKLIMTNSWLAPRRERTATIREFDDVGLIGINFMRHYDFLFDHRDLVNGITEGMFFIPITPPAERNYGFFSFLTEAPEFGILNFWSTYMGLMITSILMDSPAYTTFGLRLGSIIAKINGESVHNFSRAELLAPLFFQRVTSFSVLDEGGGETLVLVQSQ